jgi:hypothetical protein
VDSFEPSEIRNDPPSPRAEPRRQQGATRGAVLPENIGAVWSQERVLEQDEQLAAAHEYVRRAGRTLPIRVCHRHEIGHDVALGTARDANDRAGVPNAVEDRLRRHATRAAAVSSLRHVDRAAIVNEELARVVQIARNNDKLRCVLAAGDQAEHEAKGKRRKSSLKGRARACT